MRTRTTAATVAVLLLPLAGCSSSPQSSPAASPSPSQSGPLQLGAAWKWKAADSSAGTTTAVTYKQPVASIHKPEVALGPQANGDVWATLDVKVCVTGGHISVTQAPWSLAFADGARVETPVISGGDFPQPQFPAAETVVKAGDCLRGNIVFPVPKNGRPTRVLYAALGVGQPPIEWAVPAK